MKWWLEKLSNKAPYGPELNSASSGIRTRDLAVTDQQQNHALTFRLRQHRVQARLRSLPTQYIGLLPYLPSRIYPNEHVHAKRYNMTRATNKHPFQLPLCKSLKI